MPDFLAEPTLQQGSGYKGEPVVLLSSHEVLLIGLASDYAMQKLRQIGLNIGKQSGAK